MASWAAPGWSDICNDADLSQIHLWRLESNGHYGVGLFVCYWFGHIFGVRSLSRPTRIVLDYYLKRRSDATENFKFTTL